MILDPVSSVLTDPRFPTLAVWISATPVNEAGALVAYVICRNDRGEVLFCSPAIPVPKPVTAADFYPKSIGAPKARKRGKKKSKRTKRTKRSKR
ncbi:MAG TPA: hypothetical protein PKV97_16070 [Thauera aminoaromatica]|nr:hypothetical protein [Thauera aminoaromatica]